MAECGFGRAEAQHPRAQLTSTSANIGEALDVDGASLGQDHPLEYNEGDGQYRSKKRKRPHGEWGFETAASKISKGFVKVARVMDLLCVQQAELYFETMSKSYAGYSVRGNGKENCKRAKVVLKELEQTLAQQYMRRGLQMSAQMPLGGLNSCFHIGHLKDGILNLVIEDDEHKIKNLGQSWQNFKPEDHKVHMCVCVWTLRTSTYALLCPSLKFSPSIW